MSLTDVACRNAKPESKPKELADGAGLYLYLAPTGTKTWRVDYRHEGKRQTATLGQYPRVSLATARAMRDELKRGLMEGREPLTGDALAIQNSFQKVANEWLEAQRAAWSPKHHERIAARFRRDVFPSIGKLDIATIEAPDLLKVIRAVEDRGAQDVASRIHQTLGAIFRYGIACGFCKRDPAADLRGALRPAPRVKHMAALTAGELPAFLNALAKADCEPQTRLALQLVIHTQPGPMKSGSGAGTKWTAICGAGHIIASAVSWLWVLPWMWCAGRGHRPAKRKRFQISRSEVRLIEPRR